MKFSRVDIGTVDVCSYELTQANAILLKSVYPKFHWLRQLEIFGRDQKGAMANTK